ncbi:MAG TPA: YaeQ family protein, partial [Lysobacter sp.]|nr:YaeQ family protein [Lysobacter sp.]
GQPDESRIRKACGRAQQVVVVNYGGRAAEVWWSKNAAILARLKNLTVIDIDADSVDAVTTLFDRGMRLTAMIQDGELQLMDTTRTIALRPTVRMPSATLTAA